MEMTLKLKQAVKEFKSGKAESFDTLYKESEKYIYTCIYKVMSGNNNAVDITGEIMQDAYLEIFLNISQLENEDRFLSWAGTIATRKCYAYIKKNKKYVLLNEDDDTFENLSDSDDIIPEEVMQSKEKRRLVREIIDTQLNEMQKICVYEFYYNQKKQTEIAEIYGIPVNTVKTHLYRANGKIKEGVLDLEKRKGTKLYSFAPFFVLLFNEDVMAATVPAEVGAGVMSTVADASVKAAEAGASTSVSGASTSTCTTSTVSTAGTTSSVTTTTVASKVGVLGKIAAASAKAKIIMAVATVSVVGTVGGGAIVASQNGLFTDTPTINENQQIEDNQQVGDNQETDENQLATETEEVTELVEETEAESTETEIIEEVTEELDYTEFNRVTHFRVANLPEELINGEYTGNNSVFCQRFVATTESGGRDVFYFKVWPAGAKQRVGLDLENMTDEEIGKYAEGTPNYDSLKRVENEDYYKVFIEYDAIIDRQQGKGYDLYINDKKTDKAYVVQVKRFAECYDSAQMLSILETFELLD